jgi:hypothetical protein
MPVEQRVKSILKSAELCFELGIINPTRFGPLIHANVPDYAEILLRVFTKENRLTPTPQDDFHGLVNAISAFLPPTEKAKFDPLANYFKDTRTAFRNPLHHTDRVQGYVIEKSEAFLCLLRFNELLSALFPTITWQNLEGLNYPCYLQFIKLEYDQNYGKSTRLYQAVITALSRIEQTNTYHCPPEFDSSRLQAIKQIFHYDPDTYTREVLNYRPQIRNLLIDQLHNSGSPLSSDQLLLRIKRISGNLDLTKTEIERCLYFIEGERIDGYGVVTSARFRSSSGNYILRYSFVV